jgi:pyruvate,water dikinase
MMMTQLVVPFKDITAEDTDQFGGKGANLGELTRAGFRVPGGFCLSGDAYPYFLSENNLTSRIQDLSASFDYQDLDQVGEISREIQELICKGEMPADISKAMNDYYHIISPVAKSRAVAVRSSNAARSTGITSFPGMMDTFCYIKGEEAILNTVKQCWASIWNVRAVMDRHQRGVDHFSMRIAPVIQKMLYPESSGVCFTANPVNQSLEEIVVEAAWGLGEAVVAGNMITDYFLLDKASLAIKTRLVNQKQKMVMWNESTGTGTEVVQVPDDRSGQPALSDDQLRVLGETARQVEDHYGQPQDIEWAFQGDDLFLLQTRRISTLKT